MSLPDDPTDLLRRGAQAIAGFLAPRVGGVVANIAGMVGSLFVTLFALFFLMREGRSGGGADSAEVLPFPEKERERLMTETQDLVIASVGAGRRGGRRSGDHRRRHVLGDGPSRTGRVGRGDRR